MPYFLLFIFFLGACSSSVEKKKIDNLAVDHNLAGVGAALPIDWNNYDENKSIYFSRGLDYIDDKNTLLISGHVGFLRRNNNVLVRLISISDDSADLKKNEQLAKFRADLVRKELINSGIDKNRILSVHIKAHVNTDGRSLFASRRVDIVYSYKR